MPTSETVYIYYLEDNVRRNAYSVTLASEDGTFGIKRASDDAVILPSGTSVSRPETGYYQREFSAEEGEIYIVSWRVVPYATYQPKYVVQQIGPIGQNNIRAVADFRGKMIQGTTGTLLLRITNFDGEPIDPESISVAITEDASGVEAESGVPEKSGEGFYVFPWEIDDTQEPGKYNVVWSYTASGDSRTELQEVIVVEDGEDSDIHSGIVSDMISALEVMIRCAQSIPIYFEQAKPSPDRQLYRLTFSRWNQTPGIKIYRNQNDLLTAGAEVNYFDGTIRFDTRLTEFDRVFVDYTFRWFSEEDLYVFLTNALGDFNIMPPAGDQYDFSDLPINWQPAVLKHAASEALRVLLLCINFQEPRQVFGQDDYQQIFGNLETLKKNYEEEWKWLYEQKKFGPYPRMAIVDIPEYTLPGGRSRWFRYLFSSGQ